MITRPSFVMLATVSLLRRCRILRPRGQRKLIGCERERATEDDCEAFVVPRSFRNRQVLALPQPSEHVRKRAGGQPRLERLYRRAGLEPGTPSASSTRRTVATDARAPVRRARRDRRARGSTLRPPAATA